MHSAFGVDHGLVSKASAAQGGKWGRRLLAMKKTNSAETNYVTNKFLTAQPGLRRGMAGRGMGQKIKQTQAGDAGRVMMSGSHSAGYGPKGLKGT